MADVQAVIFDLDDTLYPERAYVSSGFAAVAAAFQDKLGDSQPACREMEELFDARDRKRVFNELVRRRGLSDGETLIEGMLQVYRRHIPQLAFFPDADRALARLPSTCKLGVITDGRMVSQAMKIKALNVKNRVQRVIVTSEFGPGYAKPHPHCFEWMARALGVPAESCVYVADNAAKDFVAPNALGWRSVKVDRGDGFYRDEPAPPGGEPQHIIESLDALDGLLAP